MYEVMIHLPRIREQDAYSGTGLNGHRHKKTLAGLDAGGKESGVETKGATVAGRGRHSIQFRSMIRSIPLRSRLILAFVILIISSASATIWIGNTVFGSKVDELARDHVALHSRLASQVFRSRLEIMRLLAQDTAARYGSGGDPSVLARATVKDCPLDFLFLLDPPSTPVLIRFPANGSEGGNEPAGSVQQGNKSSEILRGSLLSVVQKAVTERTAISGIVAAVSEDVAPLISSVPADELLLLVAAAPVPNRSGSGVLMGYVLNGRTAILDEVRRLLPGYKEERLAIMLFLGDRGIASSDGDGVTGSRVETQVVEKVLRQGQPYAGIAGTPDDRLYTAYLPLTDPSGTVIGMLGLKGSADAVADVRKRTTTLFTSLIAGGMVFGFVMILLFSAWLVSPISQLAEGVSRVAEGDLDYKVRIDSADELGKLAHAFNQMVRAVKERDLRLREMTESRLTQVEKQVSIGRLAAGVAHEINNPLTAILTLSSLWLKKMPADDPRREGLEIVVTETSRCREIVRSLLDFARERPIEKNVTDIGTVVRESLLLANKYDSMADRKVELRLASVPLLVSVDTKLLQQVFINLLLNAAEATEPGGMVYIETDEDSSGGFIHVKVVDNGKGIPKEHINRVFEPFFTTKGTGKGTGLGLSVSLGIVQKHEGVIEIESEEGMGTTVTVILPRAGEAHP